MTSVLIIVILSLVIWFLFFRKKKTSEKQVKHNNTAEHGEFHCVTIHYNSSACDEVKKLKGKRILSAEAPVLPVAGCDSAECQCKFHHYEERRAGERRGAYNKALEDITGSTVQLKPRKKADRRQSD